MTLNEWLENNELIKNENAIKYPFIGLEGKISITNILKFQHGIREMYSDDVILTQNQVISIIESNKYRYNTLFKSSGFIYNPIENIKVSKQENSNNISSWDDNIVGNAEETTSGSSFGETADNNNDNRTQTDLKRTYDNGEFVDTDKQIQNAENSKLSSVTTTNDSVTNSEQSTRKEGSNNSSINSTVTQSGYNNINFADAIEGERRIANFSFDEIIATDIANAISILSFNFDRIERSQLWSY